MLVADRHDEARNDRRRAIQADLALATGSVAAIETGDEGSLRCDAPDVSVVDAADARKGDHCAAALPGGLASTGRPPGVSFPSPKWVLSSW